MIRKTKNSILILHQAYPRIISAYHIPFSVTKFLITLYISLSPFFFLIPAFGGIHFSYITTWIASQSSTWTVTNLHLDACPIRALLEVVEYAASCEGTVQGLFCRYIECGGGEYFIWKLSPFFTCTSLLLSLAPSLVDLMVNLWSSEEYLSLVLLKRMYHSLWFFKHPYPNWSAPILT